MLSKVKSFGITGIDGYPIEVEVNVSSGLPKFDIVGLGDTAIKESKERVKASIKNSGFEYPVKNITCNLAPASKKKEGAMYDVSIALGVMAATEQIECQKLDDIIFLGELSLNGEIKKVNGVLPILISAKEMGYSTFVIPYENKLEASFIEGIKVFVAKNLKDVVLHFKGISSLECVNASSYENLLTSNEQNYYDMKNVKGQKSAKRALEIAAAGGHNILMIGPPGSGKTMLAKSFASILPDMTFNEALEVTKIHSVAGVLNNKTGIVLQRPFRAPHHTASIISLVGGGQNSKPGEISLAHNGVLFLDEMPEYSRKFIETMRQPLEDSEITVARANQTLTYPSAFTLVASMNPCPCGNYGSKKLECRCSQNQIHNYLSKLSGPIMDRIDLHVEVDSVTYEDLNNTVAEESSADIKKRVESARAIQLERFKNSKNYNNSKMNVPQTKKYCCLSQDCKDILALAFDNLNLSARAHDRILKVARTIADLENSSEILQDHILEALQYRSLDRKYYI